MGTCGCGRVYRKMDLAKRLLRDNKICGYLGQMLDGSEKNGIVGVAYTQNQAVDLAKALLDGLNELWTQSNDEKQLKMVEALFTKGNIELIKK